METHRNRQKANRENDRTLFVSFVYVDEKDANAAIRCVYERIEQTKSSVCWDFGESAAVIKGLHIIIRQKSLSREEKIKSRSVNNADPLSPRFTVAKRCKVAALNIALERLV